MREILFRGKKTIYREWVYGHFVRFYGNSDVEPSYEMCAIDKHGKNIEPYHVDPSTVCQYTGLTDKNGRKIFEGDIVKVSHTDGQENYTETIEVSFDSKSASFSPWNWEYECDGCNLRCEIEEIEVIGNIFDNPELLHTQ